MPGYHANDTPSPGPNANFAKRADKPGCGSGCRYMNGKADSPGGTGGLPGRYSSLAWPGAVAWRGTVAKPGTVARPVVSTGLNSQTRGIYGS